MTDSKKLKNKIKKSGFKLKYLAKELGISYYSLSQKISNITDFKSEEIKKLCDLLSIKNLEEKEKIFFT